MKRNFLISGFVLMLVGGYFISASASPVNYSLAVLGLAFSTLGFVLVGRSSGRKMLKPLSVKHDPIAIVLDAIFFLAILFGVLGGIFGADQATQNLGNFLIEFNIVALVMATITRVLKVGMGIGKKAFGKEIFLISATMAAFFFLNLIVPPTVPLFFRKQSLATSGRFITDMISIPESNFFQGWLAPWLGNLSKTGIIGGALSSATLGMAYHFYVLGTNPAGLVIVFGAFAVASFTALSTKLQSGATVPHFLNNLLSTGGF